MKYAGFRPAAYAAAAMLAIFSFMLARPVLSWGAAPPEEVIKGFNSALLEAMKRADELGFQGRYKLLEPAVKEAFDLPFMGRQSTGRYWGAWNEEQRKEFLDAYTDWTVSTYAGRFDGYSGERFETRPAAKAPQGAATVVSRLISGNDTTEFHYLLRENEGRWKVADIKILGVSQLAVTRSQFTSVIKSKGYEGLIKMLKEKSAAYSKKK